MSGQHGGGVVYELSVDGGKDGEEPHTGFCGMWDPIWLHPDWVCHRTPLCSPLVSGFKLSL